MNQNKTSRQGRLDIVKSHNPWVGDPQTGKHILQRFSYRVRVLNPTLGFPVWGSCTEMSPQTFGFEDQWA